VNFEQQLNQMIQESPADAHLRVLQGDYSLGLGQLDDAMSRYQEAAKLDPNLALAYFSMGSLYDQRHDIAHALPMYKRAVELAPSSPQYACNLANQYFKQGEYDDAIRIYGNIRQFPLAALESAKIYRLKGDLKAAGALEHTAIDRMDAPGTKAPDFTLRSTPDKSVTLSEFRGRPVILAFYPADWSPTCGDQLALYNEVLPEFERHNAQLIGISVDGVWCHAAYAKSRNLRFPLLADFEPKGAVAKMYGTYMPSAGWSGRALFVLDGTGTIRWSYLSPIGTNPGADGVLTALESLGAAGRPAAHTARPART